MQGGPLDRWAHNSGGLWHKLQSDGRLKCGSDKFWSWNEPSSVPPPNDAVRCQRRGCA